MRSSWVFVFLALTAFSQANVIDNAISYTKGLAEEIQSGIKQIMSGAEESKATILLQNNEHRRKTNEAAKQYVENAIESVKKSKCENIEEALQQLNAIPATVSSRYDTCVNFTTQVENLGYYLISVSEEFVKTETVVCDSIQSISRCEGNFIEKWACVSRSLSEYAPVFAKEAKQVWGVLGEINTYLEKIVMLMLGCFTNVQLEVEEQVNLITSSQCNF